MSSISEETVKKIAHLARLSLTEQEVPHYANNLSNILKLVEQMNEINTDNIPPMANPFALPLPVREDKITEPNQRVVMQKLTPFTEAGLYLVPQVIE